MAKEIPQRTVAKVLWDVGFHRPASIKRLSGIPERSVRRYIKEFNEGKDHERKNTNREERQVKLLKRSGKISKASDRKKINSTRDISRQTGVNKETVRTILKDGGFKYLLIHLI